MFIVNRKIDRQFATFNEALECAVKGLPRRNVTLNDYRVRKTKKGWSVTLVNPMKWNHCTFTGLQFIQEI